MSVHIGHCTTALTFDHYSCPNDRQSGSVLHRSCNLPVPGILCPAVFLHRYQGYLLVRFDLICNRQSCQEPVHHCPDVLVLRIHADYGIGIFQGAAVEKAVTALLLDFHKSFSQRLVLDRNSHLSDCWDSRKQQSRYD